MWEISSVNQIETTLLSLLSGLIAAFIYDILRAYSKHLKSKIKVFIFDVLFFITVSIITFIFLLSRTNGEIRGYVIFCETVSFFIIRGLFSRYTVKYFYTVFSCISRTFISFENHFSQNFRKISEKALITVKKCVYFLKKLLKNIKQILYNKSNKKIERC